MGGLSSGWEKWDAIIMDQLRPVSDAMIERLAIAADQQHLDIASGTGEPGLTIAASRRDGHVVLTDLSPEMLAIADRRADAPRDHEHRDRRRAAPTTCRSTRRASTASRCGSGTCSFPTWPGRPPEFARVLQPGGRLAASVWIKPDANPWTSLVMQAIAVEVTLAHRPTRTDRACSGAPSPGQVSALFEAAGLHDVEEWDVAVELVTRTPTEYWDMISEHVSLAVAALAQVDQPARDRIRAAVIDHVSVYDDGTAVRVPGMARCIVGTR